jgi:CheY-like chemotaxis protein
VVEDEPALLEIALAYLAQLGYIAYAARNAAEALEVVDLKHPIDLLITGILMAGGGNGADLAKRIRERLPQVRVIYASGFTAEALAERRVDVLDAPLLRKPFRRAEFESLVQQTLREKDGPQRSTPPRKPFAVFPTREAKALPLSMPSQQNSSNQPR